MGGGRLEQFALQVDLLRVDEVENYDLGEDVLRVCAAYTRSGTIELFFFCYLRV